MRAAMCMAAYPTADKNGFRKDVLACVRDLDMPITRYPGGSFTNTWRGGAADYDSRALLALNSSWERYPEFLLFVITGIGSF
ncbi:MAG: hypothetical protein IKB22_10220 [Lentisphaeria bacterium]|nr:hypothetical protein [Lentisphaeria bacterium]